MKTCLFASSQLVARSFDLHEIFSVVFHEYRTFKWYLLYWSIRYAFVATLRQKRSHFPLNCVHLLHKMAEKVTPDVTSKLISVNCITQCLK